MSTKLFAFFYRLKNINLVAESTSKLSESKSKSAEILIQTFASRSVNSRWTVVKSL